MMNDEPLVSIIIPHYRGREILVRCLDALKQTQSTTHTRYEVLIIDNASEDGSVDAAVQAHPRAKVKRAEHNLGYAGGCNLGIEATVGAYVLLLNDDAVVTEGWLDPLTTFMEMHPTCAAVQPKVVNLDHPELFDYAGASGGFMDMFGFPFARGRVFSVIEKDEGQYDSVEDIFWASGACTLIRRKVLEEVGLLDTSFFAHMEEIDLNWRMLLAGYSITCIPTSTVLHNAGSTLAQNAPRKLFLNHRNSLLMLLKNYSGPTLLWIFPIRMGLEVLSLCQMLFTFKLHQTGAIVRSWFAIVGHVRHVAGERKRVQALRRKNDREIARYMYRGSVVWSFFVRGRKTYAQLRRAP